MDKADSVPGASRKLIKIGVGAPLSGTGADLGRERAQAIQLAINETNESRPDAAFASKR
jgi:ABC-type branched-subunit amino acid transport system substrate-binding protein